MVLFAQSAAMAITQYIVIPKIVDADYSRRRRMKVSRNEPMRRYCLFIDDKDLREADTMNYYDLPKDDKWLESDSPYNIGGISTDVSQIAYSLSYRVRELFPINQVPSELEVKLAQLTTVCEECENAIKDTISLISDVYIRR